MKYKTHGLENAPIIIITQARLENTPPQLYNVRDGYLYQTVIILLSGAFGFLQGIFIYIFEVFFCLGQGKTRVGDN